MDGLQRGAWIPVQGRGLVFITDDMAAAQAWIPVQGRGLVFITDDMAAAQAGATDTAVRVAVTAERVRLLAVLHRSVIATDLGDAVTARCVDQAFAVTG
jgi:hypothetical protein